MSSTAPPWSPSSVTWPPTRRSGSTSCSTRPTSGIYEELRRDDDVAVWLICWMDDHDTGFHDHDLSRGAVAVVAGRGRRGPARARRSAGHAHVRGGRGLPLQRRRHPPRAPHGRPRRRSRSTRIRRRCGGWAPTRSSPAASCDATRSPTRRSCARSVTLNICWVVLPTGGGASGIVLVNLRGEDCVDSGDGAQRGPVTGRRTSRAAACAPGRPRCPRAQAALRCGAGARDARRAAAGVACSWCCCWLFAGDGSWIEQRAAARPPRPDGRPDALPRAARRRRSGACWSGPARVSCRCCSRSCAGS